ncbi:hypothetical protein LZU96_15035 [Pantoea agglomerans]|uniref:hypothetical protein n=1 Tax=Enterobacter agglomerans TaxID=549 RepID=UPI001F2905D9|nr:hypothetical protein [Pantoea agglomerans]UIL51534.1 hypothetical protein LZU96_15035 [Pantoea agglomerans]
MRTEDDLKEIKESLHRIAYGGRSTGNLWAIIAQLVVFNFGLVFMIYEHSKGSIGLLFALVYGISAALLFLSRWSLIPLFICYVYVSLCWSIIPFGVFMDAKHPILAWGGGVIVFAFFMWLHIFYVTDDVFKRKIKGSKKK